jgi:flagellar hook assembly protein FlgD/outer membrane protein OmpA-like peptidoglycan-associated protein
MVQKKSVSVILFAVLIVFAGFSGIFADAPASPKNGADAVPDLYAPALAGPGGFTTTQGGAPAGALNPAAGGDAQRIMFDAGYLGLPGFNRDYRGYGNAIELGALFPTKFAVLGGSLRFINSPNNDAFPIKRTFGGNFNIAKELSPGMLLGAGLNFGFGDEWTLSGDLGFRYNTGRLGFLDNFTWAVVLRSMGKSWTPSWFTPIGGVSFDIYHKEGEEGKPDPMRIGFSADIGIPSLINFEKISMTFKTGLFITFAETVTVSVSWPGASGLNVRELAEGAAFPAIPSVGLGVNFALKTGGKRIVGGRLPSDGNLAVNLAAKPLYTGIWGMGAGLTWAVGVLDKTPPVITVDYPETAYISPNNDGLADFMEFPVTITDSRYITEWVMEIRDDQNRVVRTYRNKDRRPEMIGIRNFFGRLVDVKSGVEVPPVLLWDGVFDSGDIAADGTYTFTISAWDDNNNASVSPLYNVVVDNTPPEITVEELDGALRVFSPDGDGNKDTLAIPQSGSEEDLWEGAFYDSTGALVRSFSFKGKPETFVWDGTDDEGRIVADGVYSYRISGTDKALNTSAAGLENIIVSTIQPSVNLLISDAWFSPNGDGVQDTVIMSFMVPVREGIAGWELRIRDSRGAVRRSVSGASPIPVNVSFDGRDDQDRFLSEGVYQGSLEVSYGNGYISSAVSPAFTLDITAPSAVVRTEYPAFSPDNDGSQDEMIIYQQASNEQLWVGDIRRVNGQSGERPVRSFRFQGIPPSRVTWDGHGDSGTFASDGDYYYELYSTDQAGNTGRSGRAQFALSTADTPVMITTDLRSFSPNADGVKDVITVNPVIQVREGISSYKIEILDSGGSAARTFEGRSPVPASIPWNGRTDANAQAEEGTYTAKIELRYVQGNQPSAVSLPFVLDITAPRAELSASYTVFSPNGDGRRDFIPLNVGTDGDEEWDGIITDTGGRTIKAWNWRGRSPSLAWDGTDQAGNNVPDGIYFFTLSSADEAGNSVTLTLPGITVDARVPALMLTSSISAVAPSGDAGADLVRFGIMCTPQDGIESWSLELKDESGGSVKTFSGVSSAPAASINWNGLGENNAIREGKFTPVLTVRYTKGDLAVTQAAPVTVDVSGPVLSFVYTPEYFSPDNDGVDDDLIMTLSAVDVSPIASWSLEIRETEGTKQLFYRIEGRGSPSERLTWNGRSNRGELVQAATDYSYTFRAQDTLDNASSVEGIIGVDVLVIRDGDRLRIQVPSITFRANFADFKDLPQDRLDTNTRVLKRIAEILNKFRDYKITVEGHANPVIRTQKEEVEELRPLSLARARAVIDQLVSYGVFRGRLSAEGVGGSRTVADPADRDNNWKNRRVEFILVK